MHAGQTLRVPDIVLVVEKPRLTEHPVVKRVADKIGATTGQVLIAWGAKRGFSVLAKSVQEGKLSQFPLFHFA